MIDAAKPLKKRGRLLEGRMKWFDRIGGVVGLVSGLILFVPGCFVLISSLFGFCTVGLTPHSLRYALYALSALAVVQIIGSVNSIRWAGKWE